LTSFVAEENAGSAEKSGGRVKKQRQNQKKRISARFWQILLFSPTRDIAFPPVGRLRLQQMKKRAARFLASRELDSIHGMECPEWSLATSTTPARAT
jgi:hypothetical protein